MSPDVNYAPLASKEEENPSKAGLATENPPAEETGTIRPPPAPEPARVHRGWKYLALGFVAVGLVGAACPPGPPPHHHHHRGGPPCGGGGRGRHHHHRPDDPPGHHHGPDDHHHDHHHGPDDHHHDHHHGPDEPCPPPDRPHHGHHHGPDGPHDGPRDGGVLGWLTAPPPVDPDACRAAANAVPSECGDAFAALFDEISRSDADEDAADVEGRVSAIVASCEWAADVVADACRPAPRFPAVARFAAAFGFGPEGAEGAEGAEDEEATSEATSEGTSEGTSEETAPAPSSECKAAKAALKKPCEDDPAEAANDLAEGHISALEAARRIAKAAEECAAQSERVARACEGPFNPPVTEDLDAEDDEHHREHRRGRARRDEDFERMDFETANDACGSAVAEMKMECASAAMAAAAAEGLDIPERAAAYARAAEECAEEAKDVVDACLD